MAYYPMTVFGYRNPALSPLDDPATLAAQIRVPTLMLQAEHDKYLGCCIVERARALETAARARNAPFTLVVYPGAEHGYTLVSTSAFSGAATADSWSRTSAMLRRHHPIPGAAP